MNINNTLYIVWLKITDQNIGAPSDNAYNYLSVSVDRFMWNHPDALVIFAAGNVGPWEEKNAILFPEKTADPSVGVESDVSLLVSLPPYKSHEL